MRKKTAKWMELCTQAANQTNPHKLMELVTQTTLLDVSSVVKQLKTERDRVAKQLKGMDAAIMAFAGVYSGDKPTRKRRRMSLTGRKRTAAAQRRR